MKREGLRLLKVDGRLTEVARKHSWDMAENNFFDHHSPTNGILKDRLAVAGIVLKKTFRRSRLMGYGENIAVDITVEDGQKNLMDSKGHRKNILHLFIVLTHFFFFV